MANAETTHDTALDAGTTRSRLARVYAESLLAAALKQSPETADATGDELTGFVRAAAGRPEVGAFLASPAVGKKVKAAALAAALKDEQIDLVLTGLQSDDQGFAQVGVILAEKLGMAHSTIIMEVQVDGSTLRVKRELEGGWFQWISMPLPAVLTIQSGINQLRYATLKGIMAAKKKEIRTIQSANVPAFQSAARQRITSIYMPQKQKQTRMITGTPAEAAKELVRALREEARVF